MFRRLPFAATALIAAASGVLLFAAVVFLPMYLQSGLGFGALGSALHTLPLMLGITIGALLAGRALRGGASVYPVLQCRTDVSLSIGRGPGGLLYGAWSGDQFARSIGTH
jgi:hypothetical protein